MSLSGWIFLAVILGGTAALMYVLHNDKSGAVPCCGCGQCVAAGHCVMQKRNVTKKGKKPEEPS